MSWSIRNGLEIFWDDILIFKAANAHLASKYFHILCEIRWTDVMDERKNHYERSNLVVRMQRIFWKMTDNTKNIVILDNWPWLHAHKHVKQFYLYNTTTGRFITTLKTKRQALHVLEEFAKRDVDLKNLTYAHKVIQNSNKLPKKEKEPIIDLNGYKWELQKKTGKFGVVKLINMGTRKGTYALVYLPTKMFVHSGDTQKKTKEIAAAWNKLPENIIEEAMADWTYIQTYKAEHGDFPEYPGPNGEHTKVRHMSALSNAITKGE